MDPNKNMGIFDDETWQRKLNDLFPLGDDELIYVTLTVFERPPEKLYNVVNINKKRGANRVNSFNLGGISIPLNEENLVQQLKTALSSKTSFKNGDNVELTLIKRDGKLYIVNIAVTNIKRKVSIGKTFYKEAVKSSGIQLLEPKEERDIIKQGLPSGYASDEDLEGSAPIDAFPPRLPEPRVDLSQIYKNSDFTLPPPTTRYIPGKKKSVSTNNPNLQGQLSTRQPLFDNLPAKDTHLSKTIDELNEKPRPKSAEPLQTGPIAASPPLLRTGSAGNNPHGRPNNTFLQAVKEGQALSTRQRPPWSPGGFVSKNPLSRGPTSTSGRNTQSTRRAGLPSYALAGQRGGKRTKKRKHTKRKHTIRSRK